MIHMPVARTKACMCNLVLLVARMLVLSILGDRKLFEFPLCGDVGRTLMTSQSVLRKCDDAK